MKVSKKGLKIFVFIFMGLLISFVDNSKVSALDYSLSVDSVENLVYGNEYGEGTINGTTDIQGEFSFEHEDDKINDVGQTSVDIIFTPQDTRYPIKKLTINAVIEQRKISVVFDSLLHKQYDGTTNLQLPEYRYDGILNDEVSIVGDLKATLESGYVGETVLVDFSGIEIQGTKKDFYYLDLENHTARIYPSTLQNYGHNATTIMLDDDVFVDIGYSLKVDKKDVNENIENLYTSFAKYDYVVYNHKGIVENVDGQYKVTMNLSNDIMNMKRLELFELTNSGEYKELNYTYKDGKISFSIDSHSSFVLATRDIEYKFIWLFSSILFIYACAIVVSKVRNEKVKSKVAY